MARALGVALLLGIVAGAVATAAFDGVSDYGLLAGSVVFLVALLRVGRPVWRWPLAVILPGVALSVGEIAGWRFRPWPSENWVQSALQQFAVSAGTFIIVLVMGVVAVVLLTRRRVEPRAAMTEPVLALFCGLVILAYGAAGLELATFVGDLYDWRVVGLIVGLLVGIGQSLAVARYPVAGAHG